VNAGTKVGGFLAGLVLVGVAGAGVGTLAGPVDTAPAGHDDGGTTHAGGDAHEPEAEPGGHAEHPDATEPADDADDAHAGHGSAAPSGEAEETAGTTATQDGYRLALDPTADEIRFQVLDPDGAPVVDTEILHERPLHLIVVGRDLVGYAHLHPEVAADGTWSVARPALAPGSYRVVADLQPVGGPELALAGDLAVPGTVPPGAVPAPAETATVDDLTVTLDGHAEVGEVELAFTVTRDGAAVPPEPYLGARGHLVAFRTDDLAYSHVHPHDGDEGPVRFTASFPTEGTYRLFLDLQVDGAVRTFGFTVEVHGHEH
jgi:hypothetical protein